MKPIVEKIKLTNLGKCKVIILILVSIITFSLINSFNTVDASTTYEDGEITAVLDDNGTLTISGSGEINQSLIRKFDYKTSIKNVKIEKGVTSIGDLAFLGCTSLTNIEIPEGVTSIGVNTFDDCTSLERINVNQNNEKYTNDEQGVLYNKNMTELIRYPEGKKDIEYSIPEGVTSIGNIAFYKCTSLTSIEIPEGVTSIGKSAFYKCTSLTSIEIPEGVTSIEAYTFYHCISLERINVNQKNEKYTNDEKGVLYNKNKTELIKYPAGKKDTEYSIPKGVTSIGENAFEDCTSLISIEIPEGVTIIGENAFKDCKSLISIELPEGVTSIGYEAFYKCESLTNIVIPSSVMSISDWTFNKCTSLTNIELPEGVTSIGNLAFWGCTSLTSIKIPSSVTSIGDRAFSGCENLTSIVIPSSVMNIGNDAFWYCTSLTIYCKPNTTALQYAIYNKINYAILGDINRNDKIDVADILQILRHISAEKTQENQDWLLSQDNKDIADVNRNKNVDVQDALLIRRYIAANKNEEIAQKHPDWMK